MEAHNAAVREISEAVRGFYDRNEKFRINHGSTNSTRPRDHKNAVNVGHLNHILHVDTERKTVLVEPNVPMDRLVEGTLTYGLVPPVVMEFPGITVGGGYSGTSGESSSFKHGYFDRTINFVEMVLADGSIITCSQTDKPDLFNGAAGALGTLGITTMVEIQLLEAKTYVETTYIPTTSIEDAVAKVRRATEDLTNDYVDGILYSPTSGVIITGRMTNEISSSTHLQTFSRARDPWFYLHAQKQVRNPESQKPPVVEAIPLAEYLFRYDRGGFWVGRSAFTYFWVPFNRITRWFLDDALHTRMMYTALHASGQSRSYVVQDLAIPYEHAENFIDYTAQTFNIWPLWLCPLKTPTYKSMHPRIPTPEESVSAKSPTTDPASSVDQMLNVGLWGYTPRPHNNFPHFLSLNKSLESYLSQTLSPKGIKWLYAHTYYTAAEFWSIYNKDWYTSLRRKYNAEKNLPDVYEKTVVDVERQRKEAASFWWGKFGYWSGLGGVWGLLVAIRSGSWRDARRSTWKWTGNGKDGRMSLEGKGKGKAV